MKASATIVAALLAASALASPGLAQVSDDVVKIGVLTDMAGVTSDVTGKGSLVATQMAVEEFGGSVLGKPIQVISADHQHKVEVGATTARRWFDTEAVDVIAD